MKLFRGKQDILSLIPGISIHWEKNCHTGKLYTFTISIDWIFWFAGVDFIDYDFEQDEIDRIRRQAEAHGLILELEEATRSIMEETDVAMVEAYRMAAYDWDL